MGIIAAGQFCSYTEAVDRESREFLENISQALERRIDGLRDELHAELRDVREAIRGMKTEMRETREQIRNVGSDYREARRARDIRTISVESRLEELERRMSEYENGHP